MDSIFYKILKFQGSVDHIKHQACIHQRKRKGKQNKKKIKKLQKQQQKLKTLYDFKMAVKKRIIIEKNHVTKIKKKKKKKKTLYQRNFSIRFGSKLQNMNTFKFLKQNLK